jgi:hypothetical protein
MTARQRSSIIFRKVYPTIGCWKGGVRVKVNFEESIFLWQGLAGRKGAGTEPTRLRRRGTDPKRIANTKTLHVTS